jgi:calcium/calmodulin-dependent protein kinase I
MTLHIEMWNLVFLYSNKDNILVGIDGKVRLIDFGLSQQSESKISYDKCGTLLFMAPEMILKLPYLKSVDLWSIGII